MALFGFGKKKEAQAQPAPACGCGCSCAGGCGTAPAEVPDGEQGVIRVLGAGCKNCQVLLEHTREAVEHLGLKVRVEYITDMEQIMAWGVMSMPALVVDGKVVSMGRVLSTAEVEKLLEGAAQA
jgi:small redox-active disulfide protein 2